MFLILLSNVFGIGTYLILHEELQEDTFRRDLLNILKKIYFSKLFDTDKSVSCEPMTIWL